MNTIPTIFSTEKANLDDNIAALREAAEFAAGKVNYLDRFMDQHETLSANCAAHGDFKQLRIWVEYSGRSAEKFSECPCCIQDKLAAAERRLKDLICTNLLNCAGIASRFADCEFSNYKAVNADAAENLAVLRDYAGAWPQMFDQGTGLILTGKPGTGKNHLAVSLTKELIRMYQADVRMTSVMRIIRAVRRTWNKASDLTEDDVIREYTSRDLLIIDEVGVQMGSDSEKLILFEIINTRYENQIPTILLSNLPLPEISAVIGERLTDRMVEGGGATLVFDWESYRSQKGATAA